MGFYIVKILDVITHKKNYNGEITSPNLGGGECVISF